MDELQLVWPGRLFAEEAAELLHEQCSTDVMECLLDEAFADDRGVQLLRQAGPLWKDSFPHVSGPGPGPGARLVLDWIQNVDEIPRYTKPKYWSARHRPVTPAPPLTVEETKGAFADAVIALAQQGYFDEAFGSSCPDSRGDPGEGQRRLEELLETTDRLWPLIESGERTAVERCWSEDVFFDMVEVLHDLVARPRARSWHDFHDEWDYADFARYPGRAVYRWRINEILQRSTIGLRLADDGEDVGRLVHATTDDRTRLVEAALVTPDGQDRDEVTHAIALFRGRGSSREDRRSAVVALARVLEDRRPTIKTMLTSKDEGDLFNIANNFDIRHRRCDQQGDYDDAFLDWVFWWYLATVELTDRILRRCEGVPQPDS